MNGTDSEHCTARAFSQSGDISDFGIQTVHDNITAPASDFDVPCEMLNRFACNVRVAFKKIAFFNQEQVTPYRGSLMTGNESEPACQAFQDLS